MGLSAIFRRVFTEEKSSEEVKNENKIASTLMEKEEAQKEWGYDLYPERRGEKFTPSIGRMLWFGESSSDIDKLKCEKNVYSCAKNSPLIKLMMGALRSSGCEIDLRRHIACEFCDPSVTGGYDPLLNQIVVCQNVAKEEGLVQGVMAHEMVHMFDYCRHKLDFKNLKHLACTEVRAANLTNCSYMSACVQGDASPIRIQQTHRNCVRTKAIASVKAVRNVTDEQAAEAVDSVFDKCYKDLEPIGRRIRRNSYDMHRAYYEGHRYGYT
ncbi:mitochondrial inner membrane protease ATP23 homolog [Neocloeon triangulifer]|uniref:mitochondrial inner membrane protease ATP23 homolog n=1 Tax=Neocloeon triangulifer TaxID=2078957 RepID=UPI00286F52BB|nr:mitochondrial inner membrane protease ATP23 homolog [Neocloeon triangulifer]XP_059481465.1 mitochondrial inner membrane protease ATP23 homolog [Neocloeon triangulifer]